MFSDLHLCLWFGILIRDWPWHRRDAPPPLRTLIFRLGLFGMWSLRDCMDPMWQCTRNVKNMFVLLTACIKKAGYIYICIHCWKVWMQINTSYTCVVVRSHPFQQTFGKEKKTWNERVLKELACWSAYPYRKGPEVILKTTLAKPTPNLTLNLNKFNHTFSSGPCSSSMSLIFAGVSYFHREDAFLIHFDGLQPS